MSNTQVMLELAIDTFGVSDKITIMLSQRRDKEIVEKQKELIYEGRQRAIARKYKESRV